MSIPDWMSIREDTVIFNIPPTRSITYSELPNAVNAAFEYFSKNKTSVIKITGRGPIWLYCAVVHAVAHLSRAVAVYDAIFGKYIVVVSHDPNYTIGEVI
ncbi:MAG: CRISPR-associated protein Csx3 [Nitrososphaeria archaeon]|nr:CRISPR-associated protein Csx3 [Nitrososphaeria archaeon]MDW7986996.1 CRISPR-associated protein Csx3 [Nitrososphaerota archaeon]